MASCEAAHKEYDHLANGKVQIGTLPAWTRVHGKVAWSVVHGPYTELNGPWQSFPDRALAAARSPPDGPCGDVYVCKPRDHTADPSRMLTILYAPIA